MGKIRTRQLRKKKTLPLSLDLVDFSERPFFASFDKSFNGSFAISTYLSSTFLHNLENKKETVSKAYKKVKGLQRKQENRTAISKQHGKTIEEK
jgi:hypothetical protein